MAKEKIQIKCYGKTEQWDSREAAINYYYEGMIETDGSERERYTSIYLQL